MSEKHDKNTLVKLRNLLRRWKTRIRFCIGVRPLSESWGGRGAIIHRYYLEEFLQQNATCVHGRCLEFQENSYTTKFGKDNVQVLDIINKDEGGTDATIVADLTTENGIPDNQFDCIICTYVLHLVYDSEKMVAELHRILKPGGSLLVSVPDITINYPIYGEYWRFTVQGLEAMLARHFGDNNVFVTGYGNSLIAAGEIRGMVLGDFTESELANHDPRYSLVVCARAVKQ